jgi:exonuclease SbcC
MPAMTKSEARIEAGKRRVQEIDARMVEIGAEQAQLAGQVDETVAGRYQAAEHELEVLRAQYTTATAEIARLEAELKAASRMLDDLRAKAEQHAALTAEIATAEAEARDWRYLERACGRDGIQALELDAMGPGIAEVANKLLDAAYGSRFRVEIRTTRLAGKGSKTRQVEDFEIIIKDTERGTEQPLDTLSGGETVWIRKALYDAFGVIRAKSTGTKILTVCLDEADGALDPDARRRYIAMLQAAHAAAGRHHTIVISHSDEAQQAIGQRIVMAELAGSANGGKEAVA